MSLKVGMNFSFPRGIVGFPADSVVSITKIDNTYVWLTDSIRHHKMPLEEFQKLHPREHFTGLSHPPFKWHPENTGIRHELQSLNQMCLQNPYVITL